MELKLVEKIKKAAKMLHVLENKRTRSMLEYLIDHPNTCVTDLFIKFRVEQATASQALMKLRQNNLAETKREGKTIYYSAKLDQIVKINHALKHIK